MITTLLDVVYSCLVPLAAIALGLLFLWLFAFVLTRREKNRDTARYIAEGGIVEERTRAERVRERRTA